MKSIISKTMMLVAVGATLLSFSPKPGGEGFEISLNNRLLIHQYGNEMNTVKSLQLDQSASNDQLTIKYYHCGQVAKNRVITIKDGQDNILKQFRYADVTTPSALMGLNVKDVLNLKKGNTSSLKMYYSSSQLPNGRMLASILF